MNDPEKDCKSQLQKLTAEYEEFAYIVSHDLKAPVRAINNLASWIEEDLPETLSGDVKTNFGMLKKRVSRLENMIQALLEFSRANRLNLQTGTVDINQQLAEISTLFAKENNLKVTISGEAPPFPTYVNKLYFVLQELFRNAIFFNDKSQTEITVNLQENKEEVSILFTDNGPGIPEANIPKIFTIFYTAQAKDTLETTGAGLAIVNKIINFVGGKIEAENAAAGGLKIRVTWPKKLPDIMPS